ncbi:hypothetical protein ACLOJK_017018 [Asimina triloba]
MGDEDGAAGSGSLAGFGEDGDGFDFGFEVAAMDRFCLPDLLPVKGDHNGDIFASGDVGSGDAAMIGFWEDVDVICMVLLVGNAVVVVDYWLPNLRDADWRKYVRRIYGHYSDDVDVVGDDRHQSIRFQFIVAVLLVNLDLPLGCSPKNPSLAAMAAGLRRMMEH